MPWFPEFYSAVELARRDTHAEAVIDPVGQYFTALQNGDTRTLETAWAGHVVVFHPRAGKVSGHSNLRRFVERNQHWLAERNAKVRTVGTSRAGNRTVVELLVQLDRGGDGYPGAATAWPVAVVAESTDHFSVVFRTYCSQSPVDGRQHVRSPILSSRAVALDGVIRRFRAALEAGDADAAVSTFMPDGYIRESIGPRPTHRGAAEMHSFLSRAFSVGGGIVLQDCVVTDDRKNCALEYNCVRWGSCDVPPQAGLAVFERGCNGLLAALRIYDDVRPPSPLP